MYYISSMKNIITLILSFITINSFSQSIEFDEVFNFYEGKEVFVVDAMLIDSLMITYGIDTTGYTYIKYFDDFELNVTLRENFQHTLLVYNLNKENNDTYSNLTINNSDMIKLNQYMLIYILDSEMNRILNIVQF